MLASHALPVCFTTLLLLLQIANGAGLYTKNSPVIQLDGKSYESVIARSNYTSVSPRDDYGLTSTNYAFRLSSFMHHGAAIART